MPFGINDPARTLLVTAAELRAFTGYKTDRDAETVDVEAAIRSAQAILIGQLTNHVVDLVLEGDVDGSNTRFAIPRSAAARVIFDDDLAPGVVSNDLLVQAVSNPPTGLPAYEALTVSSVDALNGAITLSAAPSIDYDHVIFTGRVTTRRLDQEALKTAIMAQAALLLDARVREAGKVNLANPEAQKRLGNGSSSSRRGIWEDALRAALKALRNTTPVKAGIRTTLPRVDDSIRTVP